MLAHYQDDLSQRPLNGGRARPGLFDGCFLGSGRLAGGIANVQQW